MLIFRSVFPSVLTHHIPTIPRAPLPVHLSFTIHISSHLSLRPHPHPPVSPSSSHPPTTTLTSITSPPSSSPLLTHHHQLGVLRCDKCRTYINPYVYWPPADRGARWKCNMCSALNDVRVQIFFVADIFYFISQCFVFCLLNSILLYFYVFCVSFVESIVSR